MFLFQISNHMTALCRGNRNGFNQLNAKSQERHCIIAIHSAVLIAISIRPLLRRQVDDVDARFTQQNHIGHVDHMI